MKHKHHIIPRHAGGTDDPENIIELSVKEHADAHRILFEEHGRWQDKLAWEALSGLIGKEEITRRAQSQGQLNRSAESKKQGALAAARTRKLHDIPAWNKGLTKDTHAALRESSIRSKRHQELGIIHSIGDSMRGKEFSNEHKKKLSEIKKMAPYLKCPHCGKEAKSGMYARWHGDNCRPTTIGRK